MRILTTILRGTAAFALTVTAMSCSDGGAKMVDAAPGDPDPVYRQVEHLARPAINEALLINEAFNAGYNATAPSFAGVPTATLNAVIAEAKGVLKALYLGGCLLNGLVGATADTGVKPAAIKCHAVGAAIWLADGVTLTDASKNAAQDYADKVFPQFIPDVMRVDTSVPSNYLTPCGTLDSTPLLCGGRFLNDDVVDITYNYLLNGAANYLTPGDGGAVDQQIIALTSDGVAFSSDPSPAKNPATLSVADPTNAQQGHPDVTPGFPYSAKPF